MLLNLASDKPFVYKDWEFIFFSRKELESQLPNFFYENRNNLKNLYVINWPWYFSSTRVWTEVVNILLALKVFDKVYYLNKLEFFNQIAKDKIYLFSGNKNKFILLKQTGDYEIVLKKNLDLNIKFEELFELKIEQANFVRYNDILKNYDKLDWKIATESSLLKPFYIFQPIVC